MKRLIKEPITLMVELLSTEYFVFTDSDLMIKYLKEKFEPNEDVENDLQYCTGYTIAIYDKIGLVSLFLYLPKKYSDITTAHETLHLTYRIFEKVGIKIDQDNHEIQTYLQGYLMKQIKEKVYGIK